MPRWYMGQIRAFAILSIFLLLIECAGYKNQTSDPLKPVGRVTGLTVKVVLVPPSSKELAFKNEYPDLAVTGGHSYSEPLVDIPVYLIAFPPEYDPVMTENQIVMETRSDAWGKFDFWCPPGEYFVGAYIEGQEIEMAWANARGIPVELLLSVANHIVVKADSEVAADLKLFTETITQ